MYNELAVEWNLRLNGVEREQIAKALETLQFNGFDIKDICKIDDSRTIALGIPLKLMERLQDYILLFNIWWREQAH